jgi:predicted peptidase
MLKIIKCVLLLTISANCSFAQSSSKQINESFSEKMVKKVSLNYLVYLPKTYDKKSMEKWPIIFFLHGSGERGSNLELVKKNGLPLLVETDDYPFIVVSPQCPENTDWNIDALNALYKKVLKTYKIDVSRIYLTGLSMGGYGTWSWAIDSPDKFAAIAPVCGGGRAFMVHKIKDLPVWAFHGLKDNVVPISESEKMVNTLNKKGGNAKLTTYPDAEHDSWTPTYSNPELYKWFLEHQRKK